MPLTFEGRGCGVLCHCLDRQDAPVGAGDEFGRHGESIAVPPGVSAPPVSKFSHVRYQLAGAPPALWLRAQGE